MNYHQGVRDVMDRGSDCFSGDVEFFVYDVEV